MEILKKGKTPLIFENSLVYSQLIDVFVLMQRVWFILVHIVFQTYPWNNKPAVVFSGKIKQKKSVMNVLQ